MHAVRLRQWHHSVFTVEVCANCMLHTHNYSMHATSGSPNPLTTAASIIDVQIVLQSAFGTGTHAAELGNNCSACRSKTMSTGSECWLAEFSVLRLRYSRLKLRPKISLQRAAHVWGPEASVRGNQRHRMRGLCEEQTRGNRVADSYRRFRRIWAFECEPFHAECRSGNPNAQACCIGRLPQRKEA